MESNSVGQGLIALYESDENPPTAALMSEDGKTGMVTTNKSKIRTCIKFKELFEKGRIKIFSKVLLREMKSFVRKDGSYDHQVGATSDCISAFLIVLRVIEEMASYDENAYHMMYTYTPDENDDISYIDENWEQNSDDSIVTGKQIGRAHV